MTGLRQDRLEYVGRNSRRTWRRLAELPTEPYLWVESDDQSIYARTHFQVRVDGQRVVSDWEYLTETRGAITPLLRHVGIVDIPQLLIFSPTAVEKCSPDPKMEISRYLEMVLAKALPRLRAAYLEGYAERRLLDFLAEQSTTLERDEIATKILRWDSAPLPVNTTNQYVKRLYSTTPGRHRIDFEARDRANRIARHFPLLFEQPMSEDHLSDYIEFNHFRTF